MLVCGSSIVTVPANRDINISKVDSNLVPRVLFGTKVPWWIVVTWFRFIAQILGNTTIYYCIVTMFLA